MVSKAHINFYCEKLREENKSKFIKLLNSQISVNEKKKAISVNDNFNASIHLSVETLRNWQNGTFIPQEKNLLLLIAWLDVPKELREKLVNYSYSYHEKIPSRKFRYLIDNWDSFDDKVSIIAEFWKKESK